VVLGAESADPYLRVDSSLTSVWWVDYHLQHPNSLLQLHTSHSYIHFAKHPSTSTHSDLKNIIQQDISRQDDCYDGHECFVQPYCRRTELSDPRLRVFDGAYQGTFVISMLSVTFAVFLAFMPRFSNPRRGRSYCYCFILKTFIHLLHTLLQPVNSHMLSNHSVASVLYHCQSFRHMILLKSSTLQIIPFYLFSFS